MTAPDSTTLLGKLGSGITPVGNFRSQPSGLADASFASLLQKAGRGEISSGRPVTVDPSANIELTDDQLDRIATAADRIEAAGSSRAVVLIDERAVTLDVMTRRVTGEIDMAEAVATGIDAVAAAPAADTDEFSAASARDTLARLAGQTVNDSLRRILG